MVKVSVIIPVYNVESYLEECLESVINQTLDDIEIICIDDGSTDNSPSILKKYQKKDSRIKVISQSNHGQGYARKIGLNHALGDFVFFLDADDYILPNTFEKLYENAINNGSDLVIFKFARFKDGEPINYSIPGFDFDNIFKNVDFNNFTFDYHKVKHYVLNASFAPWTKLYKRKFLNSYDDFFFSENIRFEDVPLHVQVMLRAKMSFCPIFLYNYRLSNDSSSMNNLDNDVAMDIFKIIDFVEKFLKSNNYLIEFESEFNKFKFVQIMQYVLKSKTDEFFNEAKYRLKDLEFNFPHDLFNKLQYDELYNASNFIDFQDNLLELLKYKINVFNNDLIHKNNEISSKNSIINEKESVIKSKDSIINEKESVIKSKDSIISKEMDVISTINSKLEEQSRLINEKDEIISGKDLEIEQQSLVINEKDEIITGMNLQIDQNMKNLRKQSMMICYKNDQIVSKDSIIEDYSSRLDSYNKKITNLQNEYIKLSNQNFELQNNLNLLNEKINAMNYKNMVLLEKQDEIFSSNSWKVTKPLRGIGRFLH